MMKSNLNCIVSSCAYNHATDFKDTNCDTYVKGSFESLSSKQDDSITNSQNISCSAKNCTYNFYGGCNAAHVLISKENGNCDTFRVKN